MKKFYFLLSMAVVGCAAAQAAVPRKAAHRAPVSATPVTVKPATDVHRNGFTANWEAFANPNTNNYCVNVYEPITVGSDGEYVVLNETFDLQPLGTTVEPFVADDFFITLDDLDWTETPDWSIAYPVLAKGMVNGVVYSPYIDLTNNGGKYTLELGISGYQGAQVRVTACGATEDVRMVTLEKVGYTVIRLDFDNGIHDTYFTYVDYGIPDDPDQLYANCWDFLDEFSVIQTLKAGDTMLRPLATVETEPDMAIPATSHTFEKLKYLYGATKVAYDVQANIVYYTDPNDPWEYDIEYSAFSPLMPVDLVAAGINGIEADNASADARYYNLQGVEVHGELAPGMYIRRSGKTSEKVIIR